MPLTIRFLQVFAPIVVLLTFSDQEASDHWPDWSGETPASSTRDASLLEAVYSRFSQFQGSIKRAGSNLADVTAASLTYSNNLEKIETIRDDGKVEGIDPGMSSPGSISVRYGDNTLMDLARSGTPIDIELATPSMQIASCRSSRMKFICPNQNAALTAPRIEASYDFQGAKDASLGKMLTITLTKMWRIISNA